MAIVIDLKNYGPSTDPREVRTLRRNVLDFHRAFGVPVILKKKFSEIDVEAGRTQRCPYCRNIHYQDARQNDAYCFGTGYLGGFADPVITFLTLASAPTDTVKRERQGLLTEDTHPQVSAPWTPTLADGDLIILATFDAQWAVTATAERYVCKQVQPTSMRGAAPRGFSPLDRYGGFLVAQTFTADRLPVNHPFYSVPVEFDYGSLPQAPANPPGIDPDDKTGSENAATSLGLHIAVDPGEEVTITFPPEV